MLDLYLITRFPLEVPEIDTFLTRTHQKAVQVPPGRYCEAPRALRSSKSCSIRFVIPCLASCAAQIASSRSELKDLEVLEIKP